MNGIAVEGVIMKEDLWGKGREEGVRRKGQALLANGRTS